MEKEVPGEYCEVSPENIADDINKLFSIEGPIEIDIQDIKFIVHPHVYPSHKFRSTYAVLEAIEDKTIDKNICEIGCGCGTLGQIALIRGASRLVQGDINPFAVENAKVNKKLHGFTDKQLQILESDCFDNIPEEIFDVILFAMPYHNDSIEIKDPLMRAFYDPNFSSISKFLSQVKSYTHCNSEIFIAFSTKGDVAGLEKIFDKNEFCWELFLVKNSKENYDNRVYRIFYG